MSNTAKARYNKCNNSYSNTLCIWRVLSTCEPQNALSKKWGFSALFFGRFFPSVNDNFFFLGFLGILIVASKLPAISLHWYPDHQFRELDQMVKIKKTHIHHLILDQGYLKPKIVIVFMLTTWMPFIRFRRIFMVNPKIIFNFHC